MDCRSIGQGFETPTLRHTKETKLTRSEHLAWCKQRALQYIDKGDINGAFTSMVSDLDKHDDTRGHHGCTLGMGMLMTGALSRPEDMRRFIEGFN